MPYGNILYGTIGEAGTTKISRRSHVVPRHCGLSGPYNRNPQPKYYRFGAFGTDISRIRSKVITAKPVCAWAHDELTNSVPKEIPSSRAGPGGDLGRTLGNFGLGRLSAEVTKRGEQTFRLSLSMSAFGGKADIAPASQNVR
jgi:hypothetical protein